MGDEKRTYSQEEVNAILRRALEKEPESEGVSHHELLETAKEVGIDAAAIETAVVEVERERAQLAVRDEWLQRRRSSVRAGFFTWFWVNAMLLVVNLLGGGPLWFYWVLVPWGGVLLMQTLRLRHAPSEEELRRFEGRRQRQLRRRDLRRQFQRHAAVLESIVEEGASQLLSHLDRMRRLEADRKRSALPTGERPPDAGGPKRSG